MTNFGIRFLYEVFFELCLCLMINAGYTDKDVSPAQWTLSIVLSTVVILALIAITLLFLKVKPFNADSKKESEETN